MGQVISLVKILFNRIIGFFIFLILLILLNFLTGYISNDIFLGIVLFLNNHLALIVIFSMILLFGDLFSVLIFPFNLPYPLINAIGSIFLVKFLIDVFEFIDKTMKLNLNFPYNLIYVIISFWIFLIVLIVGYVRIFSNFSKSRKKIEKKAKKSRKD